MDIDSIEDKLERRTTKKTKDTVRPAVNPSVIRIVQRYVLFFVEEEFLIPDRVARELKLQIHEVGHAFQEMVKARILKKEQVRVEVGDIVKLSSGQVKWTGKQWIREKERPVRRIEIHRSKHPPVSHWARDLYYRFGLNERASKKEIADWVRLNPDVVVPWDGQVYYIQAGKEPYASLRAAEGLYSNPFVDWPCPKCSVVNDSYSDTCRKCYKHRDPAKRIEYSRQEEKANKATPCHRCGGPLLVKRRHGKSRADHSTRKCNQELVRGIMET